MERKILKEDGGKYELTTVYNPDTYYSENKETKKNIGKGFSVDRTQRHVASIPTEEMNMLLLKGDGDAQIFMFSKDQAARKVALRRLFQRFPGWKCCEGDV